MNVVDYVKELVESCPFIGEFLSATYVDYTNQENAGECGIFLGGQTLISEDMHGNTTWQYNFALQAVQFSREDFERISNAAFSERFCQWARSKNRDLPDMGEGMEPISLSAGNGAFFDLSEDGNTGTYMIQCSLIYERMV